MSRRGFRVNGPDGSGSAAIRVRRGLPGASYTGQAVETRRRNGVRVTQGRHMARFHAVILNAGPANANAIVAATGETGGGGSIPVASRDLPL